MEIAVRSGKLYVPRLAKADVKLSGPVELFMPERGSLSTLIMRPLNASTRRSPGPGEVEMRVRAVRLIALSREDREQEQREEKG